MKMRKNQLGLTLIELMVTSAISMVVIGGGLMFYSSMYKTTAKQEGFIASQQQANYAVDIIAQRIRQSGFRPDTALTQSVKSSFPSVSDGAGGTLWNAGQYIKNDTGGTEALDTLSIRYMGDGIDLKQCDGTTPAKGTVTTSTLSISATASTNKEESGRRSLVCDGVKLGDSIEALRFQFGVESGGIVKWSDNVAASESVKYVRICVIARSSASKKVQGNNQRYLDCPRAGGTATLLPVDPKENDGFVRARIESIVQIKNNES